MCGTVGRRSRAPQLGRRVMADVRPARHQSDDGLGSEQRGDRHLARDVDVPADLVEPPAQSSISAVRPAALASARLNGDEDRKLLRPVLVRT